MSCKRLGAILSVAALSLAWAGSAEAAKPQTAAVIVSPKQHGEVTAEEELIGRVTEPGVPIVLVRANLPGTMWWVQQPVSATGKAAHFKANVRFGNEKTTEGTPFKVVVVLAPMETAKKLKPGDSFKELPELPRSVETAVVYKRAEVAPPTDKVEELISSPKAKTSVDRVMNIAGKVEAGRHPVVVVRAAESNSLWWVQGKAALDARGNFKSVARFGSDKTGPGAEFRMVTLLYKKADAAAKLTPGMSFKKLPEGVDRSSEMILFRANAPAEEDPKDDAEEKKT